MNKRITTCTSLAPNYLYHLMAVARIVYDSDYSNRYKDSVRSDDLATLQQHRELISFGGGSAGDLIDAVIGLPMLANLGSESAFRDYFADVDKVAQTRDIYPFIKKYRFYPEYMQPWYGVGHEEMSLMVRYRDDIVLLGRAIARNFATYEATVWPVERPGIDIIAKNLNEHFGDRDTIYAWQGITGEEFVRPHFNVELVSAIKDGPNANSIAYDRVVFYHDTPWEKLVHLVSHEVGTHTLFVIFREFQLSGQYDNEVLYHAMESLAMYYNMKVLGTSRLAYELPDYAGDEYVSFYAALHARNPQLTPRELLRKGIEWVGK